MTTRDTLKFPLVKYRFFFSMKLLLVVLNLVALTREGTGHNSTHP